MRYCRIINQRCIGEPPLNPPEDPMEAWYDHLDGMDLEELQIELEQLQGCEDEVRGRRNTISLETMISHLKEEIEKLESDEDD